MYSSPPCALNRMRLALVIIHCELYAATRARSDVINLVSVSQFLRSLRFTSVKRGKIYQMRHTSGLELSDTALVYHVWEKKSKRKKNR